MAQITLCFGIHNHQPVGNFDGVFKTGADRCYKPFAESLLNHPDIRMSLHISGPLLDWFESNDPKFIDLVAELVSRGQVEILGGGYYEPILAALPEDDALEQIEMMKEYAKSRFGVVPVGIWLTERIWEPGLPVLLSKAGIRYTVVDSAHFLFAGVPPEQIRGYWITEKAGHKTAIFPIDQKLRYTIPFKHPEVTIAHLRKLADAAGGRVLATYADDGEKFGLWPDTYEWVYEKGWLNRFFETLDLNKDTVKIATFSEALAAHRPEGRVYLPTASYLEMTQWALPAKASEDMELLVEELKANGTFPRFEPFLRGGFWDNFLVKYPEGNRMHKRMLFVSRKIRELRRNHGSDDQQIRRAKRLLMEGQCNCAYWHGLFGGLYLNYLRDAIYRRLIAAERIAESFIDSPAVRVSEEDLDADGENEVIASNKDLAAIIKPNYGGSLAELDIRFADFCCTNALTRRPEAYHKQIFKTTTRTSEEKSESCPQSIHHIVQSKQEGLEKLLIYDWYDRLSFLDHFLPSMPDIHELTDCSFRELGDFVNQPFKLISMHDKDKAVSVTVKREGGLWEWNQKHPITITKNYWIEGPKIIVSYSIHNSGPGRSIVVGTELNLTLLTDSTPDRSILIDENPQSMKEPFMIPYAHRISLKDGWQKLFINIDFQIPIDIASFPVQTVSQSESGFEATYQGTSIWALRKLDLQPEGDVDFKITLTIGEMND